MIKVWYELPKQADQGTQRHVLVHVFVINQTDLACIVKLPDRVITHIWGKFLWIWGVSIVCMIAGVILGVLHF